MKSLAKFLKSQKLLNFSPNQNQIFNLPSSCASNKSFRKASLIGNSSLFKYLSDSVCKYFGHQSHQRERKCIFMAHNKQFMLTSRRNNNFSYWFRRFSSCLLKHRHTCVCRDSLSNRKWIILFNYSLNSTCMLLANLLAVDAINYARLLVNEELTDVHWFWSLSAAHSTWLHVLQLNYSSVRMKFSFRMKSLTFPHVNCLICKAHPVTHISAAQHPGRPGNKLIKLFLSHPLEARAQRQIKCKFSATYENILKRFMSVVCIC